MNELIEQGKGAKNARTRGVYPSELGEDGWLRALELHEYAARSQNEPESILGVLFSYLEAL